MRSNSAIPHIFATRTLGEPYEAQFEEAKIRLEQADFIRTEERFEPESFKRRLLNSSSQARIFTSKTAVRCLRKLFGDQPVEIPPKKTFTVGIRATEMLAELGIKSQVRADNAISLAQIIARNADVKEVDFFCGDKALDDLPEYLESKNIKVNKEVVYHTEMQGVEVQTELFDGIIFLSPTAVYSFFKKNKLKPDTPTFSIGATTAEAVRLRCDNPRICADDPSLDGVVKKVIEYFKPA